MHRPTESPSRESGQLETQNKVSTCAVESSENDLVASTQAEHEKDETERRVKLIEETWAGSKEREARRKELEVQVRAQDAEIAALDAEIAELVARRKEQDAETKELKARLEMQGAMIKVQDEKLRDYNARLKEIQERKDAFDYLKARIQSLEFAL